MAKDLHDGKTEPGSINQDYVNQTYDELNKGAARGYGKVNYAIANSKGIPNQKVIEMKRNLYKFSAAKSATALQEMNANLYDDKGKLKPFSQFKKDIDDLNVKYNENWLQSEYRTAKQSSHNAAQWKAYENNKDKFPNLKYQTQGDGNVRDEHQDLNGIIAPINSSFWNTYYPPNGWNCRCFVVQTAEPATQDIPDKSEDVTPEFRTNTGKTGQVFNENSNTGHRFFALQKENKDWEKRFELSKLEAGNERVDTPKGNKVKVNIYMDDNDYEKNLKSAIKATDKLGLKYQIRPDLQNEWKNPEYKINGLIADRYEGGVKSGINKKRKQIKTFIKQHNKEFQNNKILPAYAIHIDISNIDINEHLPRIINGELKQGKNLKFVIIEDNDTVIKINRKDSFDEIEKKINVIKAQRE